TAPLVALPCPTLPCLSGRPAGCRASLCSPRAALLQPAAPPFAARAPPLAARTLPFAPARRPAAARSAARSPAGRRPAARVLPCWQPHRCPHRPARAAPLLPALLCAALLADALLPACHPVGSRTALPFPARFSSALMLARCPACVPPCCANRSQWLTHDAAARLAVRNSQPLAERAHSLLLLLLTSLVLRMSGLLLLLVGSAAAARARVARVVAVAAGVVVVESVEAVEVAEVVAAVGVVKGVGASGAAVVAVVGVGVAVVAAVGVVAVGVELFRGEVLVVARGSSNSSVGTRPLHLNSFVSGLLSMGRLGTYGKFHSPHRCFSRLDDAWRAEFGDEAERPRWSELLRSGVDIFALDYDAILAAMYALSVSAEGDCYLCVPTNPGASRCFFRDSTTLTSVPAPVPVRLADPLGGPVLARSSTVLPCPAVPSGSLSGLHLPSFSTNLVSIAALQDAMVTTTTPGGQRVSICTCTRMSRHLATFTRRPGSSLYTLTTDPPQVAASAQVSASGPVAAPCLCRLLSHQTLLRHHCLGQPSLPRLLGMHSRLLVSRLPRSVPPLPPSPAPPCLPCIEGRQRAAPHSSFPPRMLPCRLSTWTSRLQLRELFRQDLPFLRLHSKRGGEFSSNLLRDFCHGEGILQSFMFLASSHQNGVAKCRIRLVKEVTRTSMIHAAAPCFLWPFAGPAPLGVSQVDLLSLVVPVDVVVDSGAARGAASGGAEPEGSEPGGAESEGAVSGGAVAEGAEPGCAESEDAESGGADPTGSASAGGPAGASQRLPHRREPLSPQQLREWFSQHTRIRSGVAGARGYVIGGTRAGGAGAAGHGGARTSGTRASLF
ncbi:unnamed protein product, partial [Closterium sp. NIES-54]